MAITQSTYLELETGRFKVSYHTDNEDACVSLHHGDVTQGTPIIRIHSSCLFGESFHGLDCDCAQQLNLTLKAIVKAGSGAVVYQFAEGRGIGLEEKIRSMETQRCENIDTVESFKRLGYEADLRSYDTVVQALRDLGVSSRVRVASQNPNKIRALEKAGFSIESLVQLEVTVTSQNQPELYAKKHKLGYIIGEL